MNTQHIMELADMYAHAKVTDDCPPEKLPRNLLKAAVEDMDATHLRELTAYRLTVENLEREIAAQQPAPSPAPATFLRGVIDLCTQKGFSPENIEAWDSNDKWIADIWRQARELLAAPADSKPAPVHELDDDACRCEPSDYVRPADYDGDGSVAAMARRAARAPADSDLITIRKPTTQAEVVWLAKLAHLLVSDVNYTLGAMLEPKADSVLYDPKAVLEIFNSARNGSDKPVGYMRGILAVIAHWESRPEPHRWMVPAKEADSVLDDAALWHWIAEYLVGTRTDLDDEIVASEAVNDLRKLVEAATKQPGDVVAYLDVGAGGYLDLGSELSEDALQQLPKGRHALVIAGTYGIDGYAAAPQPSPTAQADSVQEDAARYRWLREGNDAKHGAAWHVAVNLYGCEWDAAIDAARKQGEKQ